MKAELQSEYYAAKEATRLVRRRPDHLKRAASLYLNSLVGYRRGLVMRASYLPIRYVDDLLDGDIRGVEDPLEYAIGLIHQFETNSFANTEHSIMLQFALAQLETKARPDDDPRQDFINAINAIIFDHERAKERRVLTTEEIEHYYHVAFDSVMNITLLANDSEWRSVDMPALSYGQGRVYSIRDLEIDWERGIINIPLEILTLGGLTGMSSYDEVKKNRIVHDKFRESLSQTELDLIQLQKFLKQSSEWQTHLVCNSLILSLLKQIDRFIAKD